jgi:hypothetical protein
MSSSSHLWHPFGVLLGAAASAAIGIIVLTVLYESYRVAVRMRTRSALAILGRGLFGGAAVALVATAIWAIDLYLRYAFEHDWPKTLWMYICAWSVLELGMQELAINSGLWMQSYRSTGSTFALAAALLLYGLTGGVWLVARGMFLVCCFMAPTFL